MVLVLVLRPMVFALRSAVLVLVLEHKVLVLQKWSCLHHWLYRSKTQNLQSVTRDLNRMHQDTCSKQNRQGPETDLEI